MTTKESLGERFIPFSSLRYCTDAFIDYRIPGCGPKYNYALIGPGVSQNPNQPINLREHHGFQIGGVSMPHGVTNPAHMHFTCEVFICTRGHWELHWGFNPDRLQAEFGDGDICSVPTWIYRGFRNIGVDDGFLFTALGGDDTGGILWGPTTLAAAAREGVHLSADYRIIDEQVGQSFRAGEQPLQPMTADDIASLRHWSADEMARRIVRFADLQWSSRALLDSLLPGCGAQLAPVIGLGISEDRDHLAPIGNAHGFSIEWLRVPAGGRVSRHRTAQTQVVIAKAGRLRVDLDADDGRFEAVLEGASTAWDSYSVPGGCWRAFHNAGDTDALALLVTQGDGRKRIEWSPDAVRSAHAADRALDANGYVGPKRFIDRSQR